ncbi:probable POL2 - DNA polymerase epsilon, calytic subunit A [Melanopsichium pennsylvanicum]|uniref:DNA polymerase epsilon catalytic subunit n=2 Tax=Melanopsichium pennsylvanicum TaxID=63383 RepID=A0AAJ4XJS6_9BASI|nr:probable POL2-DNA polymerase epsilon, calytic subunit A [Melanopsichium pennsylvanicum 4]SNX82388.1 probable POL2 - DNA polymerase epsilon, calytic subunit A [Melanopsichium pennsylvanicum]
MPNTFGLTSHGSNVRSRGTFRKRGGGPRSGSFKSATEKAIANAAAQLVKGVEDGSAVEERFQEVKERDEIDEKLGFHRLEQGETRQAWLVNMHPTLLRDPDHPTGRSGVDFYFIEDDASMFKATVLFQPYFLVGCRPGTESSVEEWLRRRFEGLLQSIQRDRKEDLKLPNHLLGHQRLYLRLTFLNVQDLLSVRKELLPIAKAVQKRLSAVDTYADVLSAASAAAATASVEIEMDTIAGSAGLVGDDGWTGGRKRAAASALDPAECLVDIREYDIPYYLRVAIDKDVRVGLWYDVSFQDGIVSLESVTDRVKRADPVVMAFDIETTKQPLKFPDAETDAVMMISYMIDGQGFLITNREIVSEDIEDFEYTPKDEYEGPFIIFNEPDELGVLQRFFSHFREARPTVVATYNGDSFDFPFIDARARAHGLNMMNEIGFAKDSDNEYKSRATAHLDCFRWVQRDSYLPQGSQGLKAVTVAKLGYDPMELDPELMTPYAIEQPQTLAQYSVSDAVATYYLYMKYVHPFIFSLCNIIPLNPDEVLRKGSGTLCETLLMVQAFKGNIIMPNRHEDPVGNTYKGHLLESETYVGGHVEALEAGVFRSDIETDFRVDPAAIQQLIDDLDAALHFSIREEGHLAMEDIENYDEVKAEIQAMLEVMRDNPIRKDTPLIYHLDVAAMYPNIMLSYRLQPDSMVSEAMCATCDYNRPGMKCDKRMDWAWRGEYFPAKRDEINMIRNALANETFPPRAAHLPRRMFEDLEQNERTALLHKRLGDYSRKVYRKTHESKTVIREAVICQRENPFYINTVRDFRDRRYEYKGLHKTWKKNLDQADSLNDTIEAKKMIVLYDSLQLAHKCILNSFYGYVMRKGARWYSMEMAGITCLTGASIIQMAKELVERIGRPLELDTDGIWCILPGVFPEDFKFKVKGGKKFGISYPCTMLNHLVHEKFTNHQYHELVDKETGRYEVRSENSIFFELDGPYKAMILPSSKEEDKLLKKRYAVFNPDGSLAELKGFEVKRRGELQLIKDFQKQIFEKFLLGTTLEECYAAVAKVANQWLDVLYSKGSTLHDEELIDLIAENKSMSKTLQEYGSQKSTAITTAKRLAEFLGAQMVKDKGLACKFIISAKPFGAPVTERAVPVALFNAEPSVKQHYLKKFLRDNSITDFDIRNILDWNYYIERFGGVIQKLITIPAAMQKVSNPVPRIRHPDWLFKRVAAREDKFKQRKLTDVFRPAAKATSTESASTFKPAAVAKIVEIQESEVEEVVPDMNVDYSGWVAVMKRKWRRQRLQRAKERKARANPGSAFSSTLGKGTVGSLFSKRSANMADAVWDVVQISPTARPGEYRMWISIDQHLQPLKLKIPRQFYVNFKSNPGNAVFLAHAYSAERVVKTLPRDTPCRHLYRITVDEDVYQENEVHFSNLIHHPNVEGVYEKQLPLDVRALIQLGSTAVYGRSSDAQKLSKALDAGFRLQDLSAPTSVDISPSHKYLGGGVGYRYFYLYHAHRDHRHVLSLFSPEGEIKVHIVDSAGLRQVPNLETMYADRVAHMRRCGKLPMDGSGVFEYADHMRVNVRIHTSASRAFKALTKDLATLRSAKQGSAMLALCTSKDQAYYETHLPSMAEVPIIKIAAAAMEDELPALGWQLYSTRRMFQCYLRASSWIKGWIDLASHFDLPLGNMHKDFTIFGADIDFARRLVKQDMVLWWSPHPQPDLGGREQDIHAQRRWDEEESLEISHGGSYGTVCLEIGLVDLAVDAVLQSGVVNEMEGSGSGLAFEGASHNLDEYSRGTVETATFLGDSVLTSAVFAAVKGMVKTWYATKRRNRSPYAALLSDNFWRWASSDGSALFEPALQRFLFGLMKKTLLQLLAEFKRLGASIVYASFNRLFLLTSKPTAANAMAYSKYLLSAVTSRELFKHLQLDIIHYWEYLLWMDSANFGGVIAKSESLLAPVESEENGETSHGGDGESFNVEMNWNIQTFLPIAVQEKFSVAVGSFIYSLYEYKRRAVAAGDLERTPLRAVLEPNTPANPNTDANSESDATKKADSVAAAGSLAHTAKFTQDLINHTTTRKLLKHLSTLKASMQASSDEINAAIARDEDEAYIDMLTVEHKRIWSFPNLPGSWLNFSNPLLELIKTTCAVLSLAKEHSIEVQILKRNLLDMINVREFSSEAEFRNPCEPFKIPLIICTFCNDDRTLDLCRDADLMPAHPNPERGPMWKCGKCAFPYNVAQLETRLVGIANGYLESFHLQDLRCNKCGSVKRDNLAGYCDCSGSYGLMMTRKETLKKLKSLKTISEFHGLRTVAAVVDATLAMV